MRKAIDRSGNPDQVNLIDQQNIPYIRNRRKGTMLLTRFFLLLPLVMTMFVVGSQSARARLNDQTNQKGFNNSTSNVVTTYVKINFQRNNRSVPDGYLADIGRPFGDRGNGHSYGWSQNIRNHARDRNVDPDQRYDTFNHMQKEGIDKSWEIELPNGVYDLLLVMGEAKHANHINTVDIEGIIMMDPDGTDNFDEYTLTVNVTDGRLTIKPADGANNAKITFIDIFQVQDDTPGPTDTPEPEPTETPTPEPTDPPSGETPPLFGSEIGINLDTLNQINNEIAQGLYDRACTEAEHNSTRWHLLVDPVNKCHYDHHHGDDPNYVNDIFGPPGAWFNSSGQSISYPWQTFKAQSPYEPNDSYLANNQMENDLKHEGYGWIVRRNQPCPDPFCITDFRLQFHGIFGAAGAVTRYHSYSFEARVCENANDPNSCGFVRNGGWADFGRLFTTNGDIDCSHGVNENFISLPDDTLFFPIDRPDARDEIRCHPFLDQPPSYPHDRPVAEWWAHSPGDLVRFQLRSFDPLGNIDPNNPTQWQLYCDPYDPTCRYNQSIMTVHIAYVLHIREFYDGIRVDADFNGRTDYAGYASRWGGAVSGCSQPGLDCVPLVYDNVILNLYPDNDGIFKEARYDHFICDDCQKVDFDLSPPDQTWISWFYKHVPQNPESLTLDSVDAPAPVDTPEPAPEPTEEPAAPVDTPEPTAEPTEEPAAPVDTPEPTAEPTEEPTAPVDTPEPTAEPTEEPAPPVDPAEPTAEPTEEQATTAG